MRNAASRWVTLLLLAGCNASTSSDTEVERILAQLAADYPITQVAEPLARGSLGGLNIWAYCLSLGYPAVGYQRGYVEGPEAAHDNWVCQRGTEQLDPVDALVIDLTDACRWQFDREEVEARPEDPDHAWSWNCFGV